MSFDSSSTLRTPEEWMALKHPTEAIWDPDGWRGPRGRPFTDPIDEAEFNWRYVQCTIGGLR